MKFVIIGDSSFEKTPELEEKYDFKIAPLKITVGDDNFVDDDSLNVEELMNKVRDYKGVPKTAAPSPNDFLKHCDGSEEGVFVITLSSKLSGTYNSAMIAKSVYEEKYNKTNFFVVDSESASCGQTCIGIKIREFEKEGLSFEEITSKIMEYRDNLKTRFLLENLDTLIKNGRMGKLAGMFAQFLHIKPILGDDGSGEIVLYDKARSSKKALAKLIGQIKEGEKGAYSDRLMISNCFNMENAKFVKEEIEKENIFKEIIIVPTSGLSSIYANVQGIICAF